MDQGGTGLRPVTVNGKRFPTLSAAAKAFGRSPNALRDASEGRDVFEYTPKVRGYPVEIRGVVYPTMTAAAKALGLHHSTISKALSEGNVDRVGLTKHRDAA